MEDFNLSTCRGPIAVLSSNTVPDDLFEWDNGELVQMPLNVFDLGNAVEMGLSKRLARGQSADGFFISVSPANYKNLTTPEPEGGTGLWDKFKSLFG